MMKTENMEILKLQEAERQRIAEDLHDTTVQELVALSQQLDLANLYFDKDVIQAKLELAIARKQIKSIIEGIRETIYDLRPMAFDDIGWDAAMERLQEELTSKSDMQVIFRIESLADVDRTIAITIYRILREAVSNVYYHAKASTLTVDLHKVAGSIILRVCDDGIGIGDHVQENHFGLQFMKEKVALLNGKMQLQSVNKGTCIIITIPYAE